MAGSDGHGRARIVLLLVTLLLFSGGASFAAQMFDINSAAADGPNTAESAESNESTLGEKFQPEWAAKAVTTWTGVVTLTNDYVVSQSDELRILSGTVVEMGPGVRIRVAGRLTVLGTDAQPVTLRSIVATQRHEGIEFNITSNGRGSSLEHLDISQSWFGITIYDSNPSISNLTITNPDYVGIDIFGGSPILNDITIQDGGQGVHTISTHWRYGIGISIGAQAAPFVNGVRIDNVMTRGLNLWGGAGGMISNVNITNTTGATQAIAAGIWVQDSIPLIVNATVVRSDNGVYVRHIDDNYTTRPAFRELSVFNTMYNGVFVERYNKTLGANFALPLNAVFRNLTIRGTGGPAAKTPDLCVSAFGLNTTGVDVDGAIIDDNDCNGFKAYMIDSSTIINNITITDSGEDDASFATNDRAGLFMRSVNWGPMITNLSVSGSPGDGILIWKASLRGSDWSSSNNGGDGIAIRESHPEVNRFSSFDNDGEGIWVHDSSNVLLANGSTGGNGVSSPVGQGFGYHFEISNDVMSNGKNVTCLNCSSYNDSSGGLFIDQSIDLQILGFTYIGASGSVIGIQGGNGGLSQQGHVILSDINLMQNSLSSPILYFDEVDAIISNLTISGSHDGIAWDAIGNIDSRIDGAILNGPDCLTLTQHQQFIGTNIDFSGCSGSVELTRGVYNFTDSTGAQNLTFNQAGLTSSTVNWISSGLIPAHAFGVSDEFNVLWMVDLWTTNNRNNGLPYALANLSFDQYNNPFSLTMPYSGNAILGPFVAQRRALSSNSAMTTMWAGCDYDGLHNDTTALTLDADLMVICQLNLTNQPPFINWSTPIDGEVFPSGDSVIFNATDSWDLDNNAINAIWTSDIDGNLHDACYGGQGWGSGDPRTYLETNVYDNISGWFCPLSDGIHQITLELWDSYGLSSNETRQIELRNLPPVVTISIYPPPDALGVIRLGRTETLRLNASATSDPEGDALQTNVTSSLGQGWAAVPATCTTPNCPLEWNLSFAAVDEDVTNFDLELSISDLVNPAIELIWAVELYNELPVPDLVVIRSGNLSKDSVTLDASGTIDPESDTIRTRWSSDQIGQLPDPSNPLEWVGQLSPGRHVITLEVSDDDSSHAFFWASMDVVVLVENTPPNALIAAPQDGHDSDSSTLIEFAAAAGSGDWDLACPDEPPISLWCNPSQLGIEDTVSAIWSSDLMTAPIGSGWTLSARLPAGVHNITLTIDDGQGTPASVTVRVSIQTSAPILILDSPVVGVEVFSDGPVLFDFRRSWDPDGDNFSVTVTSDHPAVTEPLIVDGTTEFWYNDWLPAGPHNLTFTLTDSTGASREVGQYLSVGQTGPMAVIAGVVEGQYIGPGVNITFVGSDSVDFDYDIILYEWRLGSGSDAKIVSTSINWSTVLAPGEQHLSLRVVDSRGVDSTATVNISVGMSNPTLRSLQVDPSKLTSGVPMLVTVTVILEDADGTTEIVRARLSHAGESETFDLFDDGQSGDEIAGDGVWTGRLRYTALGGGWARVEAWAEDGDMVSPTLKMDIEIAGGSNAVSFVTDLASNGLGIVLGLLGLLLLSGMFIMFRRRRNLNRDLDLIESWGTGGFDGVDPSLASGGLSEGFEGEESDFGGGLSGGVSGSGAAGGAGLNWDNPDASASTAAGNVGEDAGANKQRAAGIEKIPSMDDI
jgi:hypothetical protein